MVRIREAGSVTHQATVTPDRAREILEAGRETGEYTPHMTPDELELLRRYLEADAAERQLSGDFGADRERRIGIGKYAKQPKRTKRPHPDPLPLKDPWDRIAISSEC